MIKKTLNDFSIDVLCSKEMKKVNGGILGDMLWDFIKWGHEKRKEMWEEMIKQLKEKQEKEAEANNS